MRMHARQQPDRPRPSSQLGGLRGVHRQRESARSLLDSTLARARRLRGKPPSGGDDGGGDMLRAWMLFMGAAMLIIGLVTVVAEMVQESTVASPPRYGVVQTNLAVERCAQALTMVSTPPADYLPDEPEEGFLDEDQAEAFADETLRNHLALEEGDVPAFATGPDLLMATLPDGQRLPVWARAWVPGETAEPEQPDTETAAEELGDIVAPGEPNTPNALVLYLEPVSGEPLVLYEGVHIDTPLLAGCDETFITEAAESLWEALVPTRQTIGLVLALIGGVITLAFWQIGKREERGPDDVTTTPDDEDVVIVADEGGVQETGILGTIHRIARRLEDRDSGPFR